MRLPRPLPDRKLTCFLFCVLCADAGVPSKPACNQQVGESQNSGPRLFSGFLFFEEKIPTDTTFLVSVPRNLAASFSKLAKGSQSTERVLNITYYPLAVFRVRPVTRCTSSLSGHIEAASQKRSLAPFKRDGAKGLLVRTFWWVSSWGDVSRRNLGDKKKLDLVCLFGSKSGTRAW